MLVLQSKTSHCDLCPAEFIVSFTNPFTPDPPHEVLDH